MTILTMNLLLIDIFLFISSVSASPNSGKAFFMNTGSLHNDAYINDAYINDAYIFDCITLINNLVLLIISFSISGLIVSLFISHKLYGMDRSDDNDNDNDNDNDSNDSNSSVSNSNDDDVSDSDIVPYESQYFAELDAMPEKELSKEELRTVIEGKFLTEETPKGGVTIYYNVEQGSFEYYTDKFSDITYEILDTAARLFTITFDCKQICVNYKEELRNGECNMLSEIEYDKMVSEKKKADENGKDGKERSVFASFKSYNKKSGNNVDKKYYVITEKANRFKYKGKMSDYEKTLNKPVDDTKKTGINISYSEYKHLCESSKHLCESSKHLCESSKQTTCCTLADCPQEVLSSPNELNCCPNELACIMKKVN